MCIRDRGVCDLCGGKTVIRKDDQPATVLDRLKAYHEQTEPLVAFYRERGKLAAVSYTHLCEGSRNNVDGVVGTHRLRTDVLDASSLNDGTHRAAGDHTCLLYTSWVSRTA